MKLECYHGTLSYPTLQITILELNMLDQLENDHHLATLRA